MFAEEAYQLKNPPHRNTSTHRRANEDSDRMKYESNLHPMVATTHYVLHTRHCIKGNKSKSRSNPLLDLLKRL